MLFDPIHLGARAVTNRLVRSATFESMASRKGEVTPALVKLYAALAKGGIGTVITGYMYVTKRGRGAFKAIGIHHDEMVPGLTRLAETIRAGGSAAIFQLHHAGGQTMGLITGRRPRAPSRIGRDPVFLSRAKALSLTEIDRIAEEFVEASRRAAEAGADGVQVHAAHGYLLSQFLSPFFNRRQDEYGGSDENRYRLLGRIVRGIRQARGPRFVVLAKVNVDDGTPGPGMTPTLAADVAARLVADGVDGLELSAGCTTRSPFTMCRGSQVADDFRRALPWPFRAMVAPTLRRLVAEAPPFTQGYNAHAAAAVKKALGTVPLALVGGLRTREAMEATLATGVVDLVSLCRPFIREPLLAERLGSGRADATSCTSCNRCLASAFKGLPLKCHADGLPF